MTALPQIAALLALEPEEIVYRSDRIDEVGYRHFFFGLTRNGREVVGASLLMHVNKDGALYMVNGTIPDELEEVAATEKVTREQALELARQSRPDCTPQNPRERLVYSLPGEGERMRLAWEVRHDRAFDDGLLTVSTYVDALTGEIHASNEPVFHVTEREVWDANGAVMYSEQGLPAGQGTYYRPPTRTLFEGDSTTGKPLAVRNAYANLGATRDYFTARFNWDGPANTGGRVAAVPNAKFLVHPTPSSSQIVEKTYMSLYTRKNFGDSERDYIYLGTGPYSDVNRSDSMAGALDIVAHEYGHAVTQRRPEGGKLIPENNPSPNSEVVVIAEGISDVFGMFVERYALGNSTPASIWDLGTTTGQTIRDLDFPKNVAGAIDYYSEYVSGTTSVQNAAPLVGLGFHMMCEGGWHPNPVNMPLNKTNVWVKKVGYDQAEQILFHAVQNKIPQGASFVTLKEALAASAEALYGEAARNQVYFAWDAVGVPYGEGSIRAVNISTRAYAGTGSDTLQAGFFVAGGDPKPMLIRAVGPELLSWGVPGVLPDPKLDLHQVWPSSATIGSNDNWGDWSWPRPAAEIFDGLYAFPLSIGSYSAAMYPTLSAGGYTAVVTAQGASGTALVEVYDSDPTSALRLINISTRAKVVIGGPVIAGFVVTGESAKRLLIRAVGPTLASFGVQGALANPKITLNYYQGGFAPYTNDDWEDAWNAAEIPSVTEDVYAFALSPGGADSVLLVDLPPGNYSAIVEGVNNTEGVVLVEVYEVSE